MGVTVDSEYREVKFGDYCKICKHEKTPEEQKPCCYCLEEPVNLYSERPVKWESAKQTTVEKMKRSEKK